MSEEKIIDEEDLEGLLDEAKGESTKTEVGAEEEPKLEIELEIEPENPGEESESIELDVEEEPSTGQKEVALSEMVSTDTVEQLQHPREVQQAIQPVTQTGLVAPVCSVQESVRIFKEFEKAKKEILSSNDVLWIGSDGRPAIEGEGSPHVKRSGQRKLARFFGLSWDIEDIERLTMEQGGYMYNVRVKVWHPAGASVVAVGIATSKDAFFTKGGRQVAKEENIIMKAQTVAINRGIDDILGGGEVSAEELE